MAKVITAREAEELFLKGEPPPAGAILTPSARDIFGGRTSKAPTARIGGATAAPAKSAEPSTPDYEFKWTPGTDPKTPADLQKFFNSPALHVLKERMCDIGRRLWQRDYTDGNGGNITIRVGDNLALCTPTLICKGFMKPEDMCLVDLDGKQLAGTRKRTSEAMTHFGIMKRQPAAKSCVHAHPPHATAFAIANVGIPYCLIPEAEVFLGKIGIAKYQTPGTPANADEVGEVGKEHQAVLMQNHGVIVWGKDVEDAYWKMENIDSYCRTIWIATGLGGGLHRFTGGQAKELIDLRQKLGMPDPRAGLKECELCDSAEFRPGVVCHTTVNPSSPSSASAPGEPADPQVEAIVAKITEQILKQLGGK
ncbi:MAG TPA: class II aldolase/adducin family protein [Opitutaceae bacterium]|nr:class II aldolase/adducin family protein [Opitutaceae bacterium]